MSVETELFPPASLATNEIHQGDCLELMRGIKTGTIDLVFADPPFNIGYEYDAYHDRQDPEEYIAWCRAWISEVHRLLKPSGTFWLAIGDEYAAELKVAAEQQVGFTMRSWVVWYYTFGVNCTRKFSRSHAHLFHFVKDEDSFTFNAEDPQVRVPSARALVYGDKRANPAGRLPDDTWILRPQDLSHGFQPADDTWYYARIAGTFKERQGFHGCQMPEQLLGRIIRVSSNEGDLVLDPFAGSGTTLAVAKKLGRRWLGCELSAEYVRAATDRLDDVLNGDALDGPADPIASAPSTVNGRRLHTVSPPLQTGARGGVGSADLRSDLSTARTTADTAAGGGVASPMTGRETIAPNRPQALRDAIREAIVDAFYAAHDGYSIDWLLAEPALQSAFHEACRNAGLIGSPADWNRELLGLRKKGMFPKRGPIKKLQVLEGAMDAYDFAAEIAWRLAIDKFDGPSVDEILCDPAKAEFFDRVARRFAPGFPLSRYRWAALRLRKASRELVNEVTKYHFVFNNRDFSRFQAWPNLKPVRFAAQPGVYLIRGAAKEPLYIGHSLDLGRRLEQHLACRAVADVAHHLATITGAELPGHEYQAAFRAELVRRYQPRWNVNLTGLHAEAGSLLA